MPHAAQISPNCSLFTLIYYDVQKSIHGSFVSHCPKLEDLCEIAAFLFAKSIKHSISTAQRLNDLWNWWRFIWQHFLVHDGVYKIKIKADLRRLCPSEREDWCCFYYRSYMPVCLFLKWKWFVSERGSFSHKVKLLIGDECTLANFYLSTNAEGFTEVWVSFFLFRMFGK